MSPKGPPFNFFDILQQNGRSKNPKGSPLLHFSALCDLPETSKKLLKIPKSPLFSFFRNYETFFHFFHQRVPPSIFLMICDRRDEKSQSVPLARQSGPTFGFLGCLRREYFDTLKSFCYFWALDMAPTWAVPGLLKLLSLLSRQLRRFLRVFCKTTDLTLNGPLFRDFTPKL